MSQALERLIEEACQMKDPKANERLSSWLYRFGDLSALEENNGYWLLRLKEKLHRTTLTEEEQALMISWAREAIRDSLRD